MLLLSESKIVCLQVECWTFLDWRLMTFAGVLFCTVGGAVCAERHKSP